MTEPATPRPKPFNPLDKENLGKSVAEALLSQPIQPLPPPKFIGAGIYALYYEGRFPEYEVLASKNRGGKWAWPIYVGKAVPEGARKGGVGLGVDPGTVLFKRLDEHATSIRLASDSISLKDFKCRILVVEDIWIPLGEALLIGMFSPLWNQVVEGFGNHDPGSGRYDQKRSPWDVLHPGRLWADKLKGGDAVSLKRIKEDASKYLTVTAPKRL